MAIETPPSFHVGIIMDGNRRWANINNTTNFEAYKAGGEIAKEIFSAALELKFISHLTLWVLSNENLQKRPKFEIDYILASVTNVVSHEKERFISNNIYLEIVGNKNPLPKKLLKIVEEIQSRVVNKQFHFYLAINYSGREEILNAVNNCLICNKKSNFISEKEFCNFLYASSMPNVDLVIRTGNRSSLSGFLLWHIYYAELVFLDQLWPDFNKKAFLDIIYKFNSSTSNRKFGK